jgi:phosphoribosylformylglycinamidine (FGAM) synthase-like amidotransferase family enzyme
MSCSFGAAGGFLYGLLDRLVHGWVYSRCFNENMTVKISIMQKGTWIFGLNNSLFWDATIY